MIYLFFFFFCDCTQGQPGRKTCDYCSSHSAPSWPTARLCWVWLSLICPLLPLGTVPCWNSSAFFCQGPSFPLPLPPALHSFSFIFTHSGLVSQLLSLPCLLLGFSALCFSKEAWLWECAGSLAASLTWAWRDQSAVLGLAKSSCYARILR